MFSRFFSLDEQKTGVNEATGSKIRMIGYGAGLMLREETFPKGTVVPFHSHYHEQMCYVAAGSANCILADGSERILHAGECAYIGHNEEHSVVMLEDTTIIDAFTPIRVDHLEQPEINR